MKSTLEETLWLQLRAAKLDRGCCREFRFLAFRRFRFDFCWPFKKAMLAVEVEGGVFSGGLHTRGKGFTKDCEKQNLATLDGWRLLRFYCMERYIAVRSGVLGWVVWSIIFNICG